jgi:hypothetical protein
MQVYLSIVLDEALEEKAGFSIPLKIVLCSVVLSWVGGEKVGIGMVVIRGNAVVMLEVRFAASVFDETSG